MTSEQSDETLMLIWVEGDEHAFEALYHRHKDAVYRFLYYRCGSQLHAEELLQDVWLRLHKNREGYYPGAKFTTYLYTIARTRLIDYYRTARPQTDDFDEVAHQKQPSGDELPEQIAEYREGSERLRVAIAALPEDQREVVLMRLDADMSSEEIAAVQGISPNTVKSRMRYAIAKLKQALA